MPRLEFATTLRRPHDIADSARRIEALGFDALGVGEHVMFHGDTANGFVSLATAAGATSHIRLLSAITLVPLYPAALLAKLGAALDVASGGRFMFGVGVGGEFPKEFEACGVPLAERGARTDEALEILHRVWAEDDVTFDGRFTRLDGFTLRPRPLQQPRPPIWVSGRKKVAMRRAARHGDGWLPYMYTPEMLAASLATVREECEKAGRDPASVRPGVYVFTCVHEDGDTAVRMAAEKLGTQYAQDFTRIVKKYALGGTPDQCRARLEEYIDAGAEFIVLSPACPPDYLDRNIERIATELANHFRAPRSTASR